MRHFNSDTIKNFLNTDEILSIIKKDEALDEVYAKWEALDGDPCDLSYYLNSRDIIPHKYLFSYIPSQLYDYRVQFGRIKINDGVKFIGSEAFYEMDMLFELQLPASIERIDKFIVNPNLNDELEIIYDGTTAQYDKIIISPVSFGHPEDNLTIHRKDSTIIL